MSKAGQPVHVNRTDERGNIRSKRCPSMRYVWSAEDDREICVECLTPKKEE